MAMNAHGLVDYYPASDADDSGSALSEDRNFFLLFFLSFFFFFLI